MTIKILNIDCMEYMADWPDNAFDIAIVDPPYGIGKNWKKDKKSQFYRHNSSYDNEKRPDKKYFKELFRVSQDQIIWGANYFWDHLRPTSHIIWWDKKNTVQFRSDGELAWTSITKWPANQLTYTWNGFCTAEPRSGIHPHEKPIGLYRWLFEKYAKPGQRVLDTHLGSASSAIAAHYFGCDFVGCEIDEEYHKKGVERFDRETRQMCLPNSDTEARKEILRKQGGGG